MALRVAYSFRTFNRFNPQLVHEAWDRAVPQMSRLVFDRAAQNLSGRVVMGRSWRLRRSLAQRVTRDSRGLATGRIWVRGGAAGAPYAHLIEAGARPHDIAAKGKKPLKFRVGASWISKVRVHHPGVRARRFLGIAVEQSAAQLDAILAREIEAGASRPAPDAQEAARG